MLPAFTEHGLLPPGIHDCSLEEARNYFCTNDHRLRIWDGLLNFIRLMNFFGINRDYIILDGSFVTDKTIPSDIELVFPVDLTDGSYALLCMQFFSAFHGIVKNELLVDFYPNLPGSNDFCAFFQYIGGKTGMAKGLDPKSLKGVLRVASWANA